MPTAIVTLFLMLFLPIEEIYNWLINGWGPLSKFSPLTQCLIFLIFSDFLLYWGHRLFHTRALWPTHAIHHSPTDVNWTTAYRFHPINLMLGPWLVTTIFIFLGASPQNILYVAPIEVLMSFFVHANLNVTLGPLRYILATPVFHRWHHTIFGEIEAKNFGGIFSLWDVIFGTFSVPLDMLPQRFGAEGQLIKENYFAQILYPAQAAAHWVLTRTKVRTAKEL